MIGPAEFLTGVVVQPSRLHVAKAQPSRLHEQAGRPRHNVEIVRLGVDRNGVVRSDELDALLDDSRPIQLVAVMMGNNETGVLQPVGASPSCATSS